MRTRLHHICKCWAVACGVLLSLMIQSSANAQPTEAQIDSALVASPWETMKDIIPRHYVAPRAEGPIKVDGLLSDEVWSRAPWSDSFVDIEGDIKPLPRFRTRMKITWDDQYLYVGAELEEPHVWARLTEKNSVIYYDHDFEVFIDPNADNHNYYEFEVNALNTIWELRLARPYRDGGPILDPSNMQGLLSAVHIEGTLNDPSDVDHGWTVELAFPWTGFTSYGAPSLPPRSGDRWRTNFSRVERGMTIVENGYVEPPGTPENNWVWSAQGAIAMHMPERWGYIQFADAVAGRDHFEPDPSRGSREILMELYYREKAYHKLTGSFADSLSTLHQIDVESTYEITIDAGPDMFTAILRDATRPGSTALCINDRARIWSCIE